MSNNTQEDLIVQEDLIPEENLSEREIDPIELEPMPILDIRQKTCWDYYSNPKSETFGNAFQSAVRAGYAKGTSNNITTQTWFRDKLRRINMLSRAERVLKKALIMKTADPDTGKEQADLLRIQTDVAKHITKTLGKDEGYSERSEVTGKDGSPIVFMPTELLEKYSIPVESEDVSNKQNDVSQTSSKKQEERNEPGN